MTVPQAQQTTSPDAIAGQNPGQTQSTASPQVQEQVSSEETVDWIREAFRPRIQEQPRMEPEKTEDTKSDAESENGGESKSSVTEQPPGTRLVTQAEIDRLVQAEADRREAKRAAQARKEQERLERENNPYQWAQKKAREEEEAEQIRSRSEELSAEINKNLVDWDRQVLDPLFLAIPEDARPGLIQEINAHPEGNIVGRGVVAQKIISMISQRSKEQALAEARQTLMNDDTFVKEILVRRGGQRPDPEVVSSVGAAQRGSVANDMENFIRTRGRGFPA